MIRVSKMGRFTSQLSGFNQTYPLAQGVGPIVVAIIAAVVLDVSILSATGYWRGVDRQGYRRARTHLRAARARQPVAALTAVLAG